VSSIAENFRRITDEIHSKLKAVNRPEGSVRLLAVTKDQPVESLMTLAELGQGDFGENYVQEWKKKRALLGERAAGFRWHFIGHLQTNKVKDLVGAMTLFHSIDRLFLAEKIEIEAEKKGIPCRGLVEVNLAQEETKSGVPEEKLEELLKGLNSFRHLGIEGLMVIPPLSEDPEQTRPYFRRLREILFDLNRKSVYKNPLHELSMGMSNDYAVAIEEGATWVRIGRALLGERIP
jgi:PLP dependent protein